MIRLSLSSFLASLVVFTRIPIRQPLEGESFRASVWHLPLLGWCYTGLQVLLLSCMPWSASGIISTGLILLLPILISGAMHEDGLADFFDGLGVRHDPRQRLEVMKDPHLGSYGALALFFVTGLQWACLWELPPQELAKALLLSQVGGRWVSLLLIARLPYLQQRDSRAGDYLPRQGWSPGLLYGSLVFGVCFLWIGDLRTTLFGLGTAGILALGWIFTLKRDLGGYNGDCLGASIKTSELVFLLLANAIWRV